MALPPCLSNERREEEKYHEDARKSIGPITAGHSVGAVDCDIKSLEKIAKSQANDQLPVG